MTAIFRTVLMVLLVALLQSTVAAQDADSAAPAEQTKKEAKTVSATDDEARLIEAIKEGDS